MINLLMQKLRTIGAVTGLDLSIGSDLALYSCVAKASAAQKSSAAEPNYPDAYACQRMAFTLFICPQMLLILPALELPMTRMIHKSDQFFAEYGRLCLMLLPYPNLLCCLLFGNTSLTVCLPPWTKLFLALISFQNIMRRVMNWLMTLRLCRGS